MPPADELRAAAKTLREMSPWVAYRPRTGGWYEPDHLTEPLHVHVGTPNAQADAAWIALAGPALAEPLADLLDAIADDMDEGCAIEGSTSKAVHPTGLLGVGAPNRTWTAALAVARAQPGIKEATDGADRPS